LQKPAQEKLGFLERQRRKKEERAARRTVAARAPKK
jgi:hypothetical protein